MSCRSSCEVNYSFSSDKKNTSEFDYRKRQNTKAKQNNLRDRIQWFKDQLNESQNHLSRQEIHEFIQRLVDF
jgi:hypothetical protein